MMQEQNNDSNNNNTNTIEAAIQFDVDDKIRHGTYMISPPYDGFNHRVGAKTTKTVKVRDGRRKKSSSSSKNKNKDLTLDEAAFELVECPTALATEDFYKIQDGNNEDLTKKYYDEVSKFVKEKIGCDRVICFSSQVRNESKSNGKLIGGGGVNPYVTGRPHVDSSPVTSDVMALKILEDKMDTTTKYQRYLYMNFWRNISEEPIHNHPLAVMDERSTVKPDDYIAKDFLTESNSVVTWGLSARHYDLHEWYYFPKMTKSEGILLKQVDSDYTKTGRTCFHMAVADPSVPSTAPPRESIEVRMVCYWEKTDNNVDSMPTKENIHFDVIKDIRKLVTDQPLRTASAISLLKALIGKIPVVGAIFVLFLGRVIGLWKFIITMNTSKKTRSYTGRPEDYYDRFLHEIEVLPTKPESVIDYAKSKLKGCAREDDKIEIEAGIKLYTKLLLDDEFHHNGTAAFQEVEKNEVVAYLIKNEKYASAAKKHLGKLM